MWLKGTSSSTSHDQRGPNSSSEESEKGSLKRWQIFIWILNTYKVYSISDNNLCSLITKDGTKIKTKIMFPLSNHTWTNKI